MVAVAPVGIPLMVKVVGVGKSLPVVGTIASVYFAAAPEFTV
jgi:hypothetical protein